MDILLIPDEKNQAYTARTSDPLVVLLSVCFIYPLSGRYSTNLDQKGLTWPGNSNVPARLPMTGTVVNIGRD